MIAVQWVAGAVMPHLMSAQTVPGTTELIACRHIARAACQTTHPPLQPHPPRPQPQAVQQQLVVVQQQLAVAQQQLQLPQVTYLK